MRTPMTLLALCLIACGEKEPIDDTGVPADDSASDDSATDDSASDDSGAVDDDGDGYSADEDCDDSDPASYPGAPEVCDGADNDCDGEVDNEPTDAASYYVDADGDGYGAAAAGEACELPSGHAWADGDCDDGDAGVNPGAEEVCDGVDNDCDGDADDADDDTVGQITWYADFDGDGYGDPSGDVTTCDSPSGYVGDDTDCDDSDPGVNPGAQEVCDPDDTDEDCDGDADDADDSVSGTSEWYYDGDGDGYGDASTSTEACDAPSDYVGDDTDCDDSDSSLSDDCSWDGSYSGDFDVTVNVTTLGVSDTCSGTGTVDVVETDSPALDGTFTCSFSGVLASFFGSQTITLEGDFDSDVDASGTLAVGSVISDSWSGSFSGNTLTGSFAGSGSYQSYSFTYTGNIDVSR